MVCLIIGIIGLILGVLVGIIMIFYRELEEVEEFVLDENGERMRVRTTPYGEEKFVTKKVEKEIYPVKQYSAFAFIGGVLLCAILTFFGCTSSVATGNTGVVTTFGKVEDYTLEAGFHLKAPWNNVIEMDNRVQKSSVQLSCFSSDIQEVTMSYTINYQIDKANAQEIYKTIGVNYYTTIVEPSVFEAVKVATAKYTAEQLVQTRSDLAVDIENLLSESLGRYNIKVASTAIEDMDFTDAFTNAVEAKQVAEQKKKQAEIEQAQALAQAENDKKIAETNAKANAEVVKIQAEADMEVAKIAADSAEYQGKKEAAIALQRLASINGWSVVLNDETGLHTLYKADGTEVTADELKVGAENLIKYYYIQQWNGEMPNTMLGEGSNTLLDITK
jgi:regulator of protease activity HflC (stomatin/prohibitin superfamily)